MDLELANRAADRGFGLDPESVVPYALLSIIYATLAEWEEASRLRMLAQGSKDLSG